VMLVCGIAMVCSLALIRLPVPAATQPAE